MIDTSSEEALGSVVGTYIEYFAVNQLNRQLPDDTRLTRTRSYRLTFPRSAEAKKQIARSSNSKLLFLSSSFSMDYRSVSLQQRQSRGSLPLKKRINNHQPGSPSSYSSLFQRVSPCADETIAALALIQAASSAGPPSRLPLLPNMDQDQHEARLSLLSLQQHTARLSDAELSSDELSKQSTLTDDASDDTHSHSHANNTNNNMSTSNTVSRRIPHYGPYSTHPSLVASTHSNSHQQQQDKRFTGLPHEVCCTATTTRGRPCAYVAVHETLYCHLHASFDHRNSPPAQQRRFATEWIAPTTTKMTATPMMPKVVVTAASAADTVVDDGSSSLASSTVVKILPSPLTLSQMKKKPRGRRASKLAEKHAESPYFLLSMMPSDQWYGQKVAVLVGPMKDHEGVIEKWSNGWVSVRIPGVGLHNRRAIELAIVQEEASKNKTSKAQPSTARVAVSPLPTLMSEPQNTMLAAYRSTAPTETFVPATPNTFDASGSYDSYATPASMSMQAYFASSVPSVTPATYNKYDAATEYEERQQRTALHSPGRHQPQTMVKKKRHGSEMLSYIHKKHRQV